MKISTILLSAAFIGLVCHLGPYAGRSLQQAGSLRHHRTSSDYLKDRSSSPSIRYDESALLKQLKIRAADIQKQVREVNAALHRIGESRHFLERRLTDNSDSNPARCGSRHSDGALYSAGRTVIQKELHALEEEQELYHRLLDRLKCEEAILKVQIDLFGLSARRIMQEYCSDEEEPGPLDLLSEENKAPRYAVR